MGPVQLVRAVGHHHEHAFQGPLIADQEGEQVPAGPVGPVRILDGQDHRGALGEVLQQQEHLLEQPRASLALVAAGGRFTELGQQPGQLPYGPAGQ